MKDSADWKIRGIEEQARKRLRWLHAAVSDDAFAVSAWKLSRAGNYCKAW
jgi:hypothetical protein